MTDIEQRIAEQMAAALEMHNLKQIAAWLHEARSRVKAYRSFDLPADIEADLASLVNRIEDSEWRIEQVLLAGKR